MTQTTALLERRVKLLERELRAARSRAITVHEVRQKIFDLAVPNRAPPPWARRAHGAGETGVPALFLSDLHWGETVNPEQVFHSNAYNLQIARRRLEHTVTAAAYLRKEYLSAGKEAGGFVLILGGDMVSGDIHEDLRVTNEAPIMPAVLDCADNLARSVVYLVEQFGKVHVVGVAGNHGRNTHKPRSKFYAETNFDWLIYQMIERIVGDMSGRVTYQFPASRDVTFRIASRRYRLTHGDQFRGGDGIIGNMGTIIRGDKKKKAHAASLPLPTEMYDTMLCGHFHSLFMRPSIIVNGSLKGYCEYAASMNFEYEPPQQAFWITHESGEIIYYAPILCDGLDAMRRKTR